MSIKDIITVPNEILKKTSDPIEKISFNEKKLINDFLLIRLWYKFTGNINKTLVNYLYNDIVNNGCFAIKFVQWIISRCKMMYPSNNYPEWLTIFNDFYEKCPTHSFDYTKKIVEQNFGDWSGKKISKVWEILKNNKKKHNFSFISPEISPPNGESFEEQYKRVVIWLENLSFSKGENIVIVSHAGAIRSVISYALKIKLDYAIGI